MAEYHNILILLICIKYTKWEVEDNVLIVACFVGSFQCLSLSYPLKCILESVLIIFTLMNAFLNQLMDTLNFKIILYNLNFFLGSGRVVIHGFLTIYGLGHCRLSEKVSSLCSLATSKHCICYDSFLLIWSTLWINLTTLLIWLKSVCCLWVLYSLFNMIRDVNYCWFIHVCISKWVIYELCWVFLLWFQPLFLLWFQSLFPWLMIKS